MTHETMLIGRILNGCLLCAAVWMGCDPAQASSAPSHDTRQSVPLYDNLGALHHAITTSSAQAQRYFDQGLRFVYAFNHEEAIQAFEEAAKLDPTAGMTYWGIALALGPNINAAMGKQQERRAMEALSKARAQSARLSAVERGYIEALSKRYLSKGRSRAVLDKAYADAMRALWREYPDDPDAGVLFAEAMMDLRPWELWTAEGQPRPGTEEIVSTLESILSKHPDHPGACHYYIHAVEASPAPERALACADRLPDLMPGAGHLVHMPAHIYMRLGRYHDSVERNAHAAHVDQEYLAKGNAESDYADSYYPHNLHFLWASFVMEGQQAKSLEVARQLAQTIDEEEARKNRWKELFRVTPLWSMMRFGQWSELLREPVPHKGLRLHNGLWRLGRGLALAGTGRLPGAEGEHTVLVGLTKRLGRDRTPEEKTERVLLKIAERLLAGEIAARRGKYDDAIKLLKDAVLLEDGLSYAEPPFWPIPIRHYLGATLLTVKRASDAEEVYRTDLAKHPDNGWAGYGLVQSLHAQGKEAEAEAMEQRFKTAWTHADVTLTGSRF